MANEFKLSGGVAQTIKKNEFNHQCIWRMDVLYTEIQNGKAVDMVKSVAYPLTVEFNIVRNTFAQANTANFRIYNLAPSSRNSEAFFQDRFATNKRKLVTFKAGYNGRLITCFKGIIQESYTDRSGADIITSMRCLDMGTPKAEIVNVTFESGTKKLEAYKNIIANSESLTLGYIGTIEGEFKTPVTFYGEILDVLNKITSGHTFIDNGVVHTTQNNESLRIGVTILNSATGLLGTPQRREACVSVRSIFNPNYQVGQLLEIQDPILEAFNGTYKIAGIAHNGTISGATAGERITELELYNGAFLPNSSYNQTNLTTPQGFTAIRGEEITPVNGKLEANAQAIFNYIQKNNGQIPNSKITQNISWKDMLGHSNNDADRKNNLTVAIVSNCITIAKKLQAFIDTNTVGARISITSGWRSPRVNASISNAQAESAHLQGLAIDFVYINRNTYTTYRDVYKHGWDKFTYLFRGQKSSAVIHVQATLGKNSATRSRKSLI